MPIFKRKPFYFDPTPTIVNSDQVYQIRFTKEIFANYEEYCERLEMYRQRIWTCQSTGRSCLTLEEALISEKKAREESELLPHVFRRKVLDMCRKSWLRIDQLVDQCFGELQVQFLIGEYAIVVVNGVAYHCKIMSAVCTGPFSQSIRYIGSIRGGRHYHIEFTNENGETVHKELFLADESQLSRSKATFNKDLLKLFIKETMFRDEKGCWEVKPIYSQKYGFQIENTVTVASQVVRYPIDDHLLPGKPSIKPKGKSDYLIPIEHVPKALVIWHFVYSFGEYIGVFPFSFDEWIDALLIQDDEHPIILTFLSSLLRIIGKERKKSGSSFIYDIVESRTSKNDYRDEPVLQLPNVLQGGRTWYDRDGENPFNILCAMLQDIQRHFPLDIYTPFITYVVNDEENISLSFKLDVFMLLIDLAVDTGFVRGAIDTELEIVTEIAKDLRNEKALLRRHQRNKKNTPAEDSDPEDNVLDLENDPEIKKLIESYDSAKRQDKARISLLIKEAKDRKIQQWAEKKNQLFDESKSLKKIAQLEKDFRKHSIVRKNLGQDRQGSNYFFLDIDGLPNAYGAGVLFIETNGEYSYYDEFILVNELIECLDTKGIRETDLKNNLVEQSSFIENAMEQRKIELSKEPVTPPLKTRGRKPKNVSKYSYKNSWLNKAQI